MLHDRAKTNPSDVAFIAGGDKWTYGRLAAQADRLARGLVARGIGKGDRIALHMPNRPELAVALYACVYIGAIAVPLNNRLKAAELKHLLHRLRPALYVGQVDLYGQAREVDSSILPPARCFVIGNASRDSHGQPWKDLLRDVSGPVPIASDIHSPAVLLATSGTTGAPKLVIHTQSTLAAIADIWEHFGLDGGQTAIVACPMVHSAGLFTFLGCVRYGAPMVLFERFDPDVVLDAIEPHRCSWQLGLPFMFAAMLEGQRMRKRNIGSLRFCLTGGDVCSPQLQRDFAIEFGVPLRSSWAATEATGSLTYGLRPGPVSRIVPGAQVRLVDDAGVQVRQSEVGELVVRGPNVSVGYWAGPGVIEGAPENGWYRTGDLMRQDENGDLRFMSRKKDIIIRGGSNISPVEVELVLTGHPAVRDAAVIGVPDETLGQRVAGFVQLEDDAPSGIVNEVLETARTRLADYKVPERLQVVATIPRNALGKTDRKALLAMMNGVSHDPASHDEARIARQSPQLNRADRRSYPNR
jgi:long-chain acyl-CoA synthetase/feruloyl-CoA synthase